MRFAPLFLSLSLISCGKTATDDTADSSDTADTVEDEGSAGTLDCTDWYQDVWTVPVKEGDELFARVDTVSDATSFDPVLFVSFETAPPFSDYVIWQDDNVECSFAPPPEDAACPRIKITTDQSGDVRLIVDVAQDPCAADIVEYKIYVKVNGEHVTPELAWDDYLDDW
jgi:hypothetical protein